MSIPGYAGSILHIDLSSEKSWKEALPLEWIKKFIGGYGINNRLAYDLIPHNADPLSPDNAIIIGAGPFAGTFIPGSAKILVTTKFPINNAFATASGGGSFAHFLKFSGYDHLVITGKSPKPVFLKIDENGAEIHPAEHLWGKDTFQTDEEIRARFEPCSIISMGQAGENLVKASVAFVDKVGTVGRGGLPAVMGSKNLKAIVVLKGDKGIKVAEQSKLTRLVNTLHHRMMNWAGRERVIKDGLYFDGEAPTLSHLIPREISDAYRRAKRVFACPSCPIGDKVMVKIEEGEYAGLTTYMPHLFIEPFCGEGVEAFARNVKLADTLNRLGICHMNFSALFRLVLRLFKEGIICEEEIGMKIGFDLESALKLAEMMAYRRGFGDVLADGLLGVARRIGRGAEIYVEHIKGHSIPWDARISGLGTMEFEQVVNPRGAHVASGGSPSYEPGRPPSDFIRHGERMGIPEEAIKRIVSTTSFNPARYTRYSEDWYALFSCLSLCNRAFVNRFYHIQTIVELYSALTGIETNRQEMLACGERSWNLGRLLNIRAGFGREDDRPPLSWFQPLNLRGKEYILTDYYKRKVLTPGDLDQFLDEYYDERGYERDGSLSPEKSAQLGL